MASEREVWVVEYTTDRSLIGVYPTESLALKAYDYWSAGHPVRVVRYVPADSERWIPVGERMPEVDEHGESEELEVWTGAYRSLARLIDNYWTGDGGIIDGVTHWRELPEPPEAP